MFFLTRNGNGNRESSHIQLEQEILAPLAGTGKIYVYQSNNWWSQLKTAGSAIYANRHYLELYRTKDPDRLYKNHGDGCKIYPDVYVDKAALIHPSAVVRKFQFFYVNSFDLIKTLVGPKCKHWSWSNSRSRCKNP